MRRSSLCPPQDGFGRVGAAEMVGASTVRARHIRCMSSFGKCSNSGWTVRAASSCSVTVSDFGVRVISSLFSDELDPGKVIFSADTPVRRNVSVFRRFFWKLAEELSRLLPDSADAATASLEIATVLVGFEPPLAWAAPPSTVASLPPGATDVDWVEAPQPMLLSTEPHRRAPAAIILRSFSPARHRRRKLGDAHLQQ